jgi:hypothetical protein
MMMGDVEKNTYTKEADEIRKQGLKLVQNC